MPFPKKPSNLKVITGSREPDTGSVELPVLQDAPPAPDWLPNAHAVKEWDRLAPILAANGLLTEGGLTALGNLCALTGKLIQLWTAQETPTGHMLAQFIALTNAFGLTPVAQGKVKPSEAKKQNAFASNGKRA